MCKARGLEFRGVRFWASRLVVEVRDMGLGSQLWRKLEANSFLVGKRTSDLRDWNLGREVQGFWGSGSRVFRFDVQTVQ